MPFNNWWHFSLQRRQRCSTPTAKQSTLYNKYMPTTKTKRPILHRCYSRQPQKRRGEEKHLRCDSQSQCTASSSQVIPVYSQQPRAKSQQPTAKTVHSAQQPGSHSPGCAHVGGGDDCCRLLDCCPETMAKLAPSCWAADPAAAAQHGGDEKQTEENRIEGAAANDNGGE